MWGEIIFGFFSCNWVQKGRIFSSNSPKLLLSVCRDYLDPAVIAGLVNCLIFYSEETCILSGFGLTQKHLGMISQGKLDSSNPEFEWPPELEANFSVQCQLWIITIMPVSKNCIWTCHSFDLCDFGSSYLSVHPILLWYRWENPESQCQERRLHLMLPERQPPHGWWVKSLIITASQNGWEGTSGGHLLQTLIHDSPLEMVYWKIPGECTYLQVP